jgi:hypothetical protein
MAMELIYTSAPRGLQPGTQGFCTVAATRGMSPLLMEKLESLTGYKAIFPPNDPKANLNPTAFFHYRIEVGGQIYHVVGRLGSAGLDYTGRTNKFAHFVVLEPSELPDGGPAWLIMQPGFLKESWDGPPQYLEEPKRIPRGDSSPNICRYWQQATGDAGWGGALIESFQKNPTKPVVLLYELGDNTIPLLFAESLALLPPPDRWDVGFSTYYTNLGPGIECHWRGAPADFTDVKAVQRSGVSIWLLSNLDPAQGGALVQSAREGRVVRREVQEPSPRGEYQSSKREPLTTTPPPPRNSNHQDGGTPRQGSSPIRLSDISQPLDSERSHGKSEPIPYAASYSQDDLPRSYSDLESSPRTGSIFLGLGLGVILAIIGVLGLELVLKDGLAEKMGLVSNDKKEDIKQPIHDEKSQLSKLQEELTEERNQTKRLRKTQEEHEKETKELSGTIQKQKNQIEQIQDEQSLLQIQLSQKKGEIEQLKNQIASLTEKLNGGNPNTNVEPKKKNLTEEPKNKDQPIVLFEKVVRNGKGFPDWDAAQLQSAKTPLAIKPSQIRIVNWPLDENGQPLAEWEVVHPRNPNPTGWYMIANTTNPKKIEFSLKSGGGSLPFAELKLEGPSITFAFTDKPTIDEKLKYVIHQRLRCLILKVHDGSNSQLVVFRDLQSLDRKLDWKLQGESKFPTSDPLNALRYSHSANYSTSYDLSDFEYFPNLVVRSLEMKRKDLVLTPMEAKEKSKEKGPKGKDPSMIGWNTVIRDPEFDRERNMKLTEEERNERGDRVRISYSFQDRSLKFTLEARGRMGPPMSADLRKPDNYSDVELNQLEVGIKVENEFFLLGKLREEHRFVPKKEGRLNLPIPDGPRKD